MVVLCGEHEHLTLLASLHRGGVTENARELGGGRRCPRLGTAESFPGHFCRTCPLIRGQWGVECRRAGVGWVWGGLG